MDIGDRFKLQLRGIVTNIERHSTYIDEILHVQRNDDLVSRTFGHGLYGGCGLLCMHAERK